ncbi:hypothetical protein H9L39_14598 [Fusarium oxysporum f. sp. albedinis]|nr:hypothetical protein H9L39_14598 [Fusarium oxysporum f. sp. albedinis]
MIFIPPQISPHLNQNGAVLNRFSPRHADLRGCRSQADADQLLQRHQMQVIFRSIRCDLGTKHLCRKTNCYNYHYESSMLIAECQARGWLCNIYKSRDCNDYLDQMRYTGDFKYHKSLCVIGSWFHGDTSRRLGFLLNCRKASNPEFQSCEQLISLARS